MVASRWPLLASSRFIMAGQRVRLPVRDRNGNYTALLAARPGNATCTVAVPDLCIDHRPMTSDRSKEVDTMALAERVRARGPDHELELATYL
jgi:hypothetical protein